MAFHIKIPLTYQAHFPKFGIYINPPLPVLFFNLIFPKETKKLMWCCKSWHISSHELAIVDTI